MPRVKTSQPSFRLIQTFQFQLRDWQTEYSHLGARSFVSFWYFSEFKEKNLSVHICKKSLMEKIRILYSKNSKSWEFLVLNYNKGIVLTNTSRNGRAVALPAPLAPTSLVWSHFWSTSFHINRIQMFDNKIGLEFSWQ